MKKVILSILIIFCAYSAEIDAQVGLNTANPAVTLHVTAKAPTGTTKTAEDLLIPRSDRERAQMTGAPISTPVYINSISTGTAMNADAEGDYDYNGTAWAKLNSPTATSVNLYNTGGTVTGNTTGTQADKTLTFNGTAVNSFSANGRMFFITAPNDRVGIGTVTPETKPDMARGGYENEKI
ncbi:hypothetical protein [Chryseobacterium sp. JM1]|uniref:hypothetical protein n=1 Tax=Chryseobacterium sp. JM1 TaxID=1233950 RepID=UPI0004E6DF93|nr:hypothetical protein [Chryseobacterium sp. JM1]KFF22554.1 hypothetical protein IW22_05115 [Chryseobacterium sp. JM1]